MLIAHGAAQSFELKTVCRACGFARPFGSPAVCACAEPDNVIVRMPVPTPRRETRQPQSRRVIVLRSRRRKDPRQQR